MKLKPLITWLVIACALLGVLIAGVLRIVSSVGTRTQAPRFENSAEVVQATSSVLVTRVVDGDTIEIEGGEKIRYIGINTPETVDPRRPVQCFGHEASERNKELVEGKVVRIEKDISDRDKFGRLLRYVWLGGTFINKQLVDDGFAYATSYPPNVKYEKVFSQAQQKAREEKRGLWAQCPSKPSTTLP